VGQCSGMSPEHYRNRVPDMRGRLRSQSYAVALLARAHIADRGWVRARYWSGLALDIDVLQPREGIAAIGQVGRALGARSAECREGGDTPAT
jgi:hypothetical protein